jgi:hypothetical protein
MTLKSAATLAFAGTLLFTIVVATEFIQTVAGVLHDIVPLMKLVPCLIYLFAGISLTVFFWVFSRSQSR